VGSREAALSRRERVRGSAEIAGLSDIRVDALVDAARAAAPAIVAARDEIERSGALPNALVERLRLAHLFELWLPAALDGPELHPIDLVRIIEILAAADGSVGWCAGVAATLSVLAGSLDSDVAREIFGSHGIAAGAFRPKGRAVPVAGGFRVTGRWEYGSGILHSTWVAVHCLTGNEMRFMFVPVHDVEVISSWDVAGLRGTGSHDFRIDGVFVPNDHTAAAFAAAPHARGRLYQIPLLSLSTTSLAAVCLGIARAAIDALIALAATKTPTGSADMLRHKPRAQFAAGRAEALVRAARAGLHEALRQQWDAAATGAARAIDARVTSRLACAYAAEASAQAVDLVYGAAGGSALFEANSIARAFRDVHAATQHIGLSNDNYEHAGAVLFGHRPGAAE
jgi:indole-3-acetate monooxygenase